MKRLLAFAIIGLLGISCPLTVSAETLTTTLITEVPEKPQASYTLLIPESQTIDFGTKEQEIGSFGIADAKGFEKDQQLKISIKTIPFSGEGIKTTIPYIYKLSTKTGELIFTSSSDKNDIFTFIGHSDEKVYYNGDITSMKFALSFSELDWKNADPGKYTATITFSSEIVTS